MNYILLVATLSTVLFCQAQNSEWDKVEIKATILADNVLMLEGQGGNIGVVKGDESLLVIDAQFEPLYDKIITAISKWSDLPVEYLLNTHWHGDHTGGNNKFGKDGAVIVAHQNVKVRLSTNQKIDYFNKEVAAASEEARPIITFNEQLLIQMGEEEVNIIYSKNAHTDGDAIVHLPQSNVIHMGDTYFAGMYPFIDLSSGGSINGVINSCELILSLCNAQTKIIPGHGPLSSYEDLKTYTVMLKDIKSKVEEAKSNGMDLKAIIGKNITEPYDEKYNVGFINSNDFVSFIFNSL